MTTRWANVSLGEILTARQEKPSEEDLLSGRIRIVSKISFADGRIQFRSDVHTKTGMILVRSGDLLFSGINAYKGAIAIYDPKAERPAAATIHYSAYEVRPDHADRRFLWHLLRNRVFRENLERAVPGGIKTELKASRLLRVPIPLPPLAEQRRIVARIDELAAKTEDARDLRRNALEESNVLLAAAARSVFEQYSFVARTSRLKSATTRITKGESPGWQGFTYQEKGPVFIRSENVLWGTLDLSNRKCIPVEFHDKLSRSRLRPGDVLINLVGASIGRCCVTPPHMGEANVNQAVAVITPDPNVLDPRYLMHFLLSSRAQEVLHGGKVETARANISLSDLAKLDLPVLPIPEQRRIVNHLDDLHAKVDGLKRLQEETAAELGALLPSILDKAFTGELR